LKTEGSLSLDLAGLSGMIPDNLVTMRQLDGSARLQWKLDGRQPNQGEIQQLTTLSMKDRAPLLPFVNHLEIAVSLDRIMADAGFNDGSGLKAGPVSTRSPLRYAYDGATSRGELSADIRVNQITAIPSLQFDDPLDTEIPFRVTHDALDSVHLAQSFSVRPLNMVERADVSLTGLTDLVQNRSTGTLQAMLHYLEGEARLKLDVLEDADFSAITEDLAIEGTVSAGVAVQMMPRRSFRTGIWAKIPGMDLQMGEDIRFEGLTADIDLFRRYRIFTDDPLS